MLINKIFHRLGYKLFSFKELYSYPYIQHYNYNDAITFKFWICSIITGANFIYPIFMFLCYRLRLYPQYNTNEMWTMNTLQKPLIPGSP